MFPVVRSVKTRNPDMDMQRHAMRERVVEMWVILAKRSRVGVLREP
jgi:hypothetical protein